MFGDVGFGFFFSFQTAVQLLKCRAGRKFCVSFSLSCLPEGIIALEHQQVRVLSVLPLKALGGGGSGKFLPGLVQCLVLKRIFFPDINLSRKQMSN